MLPRLVQSRVKDLGRAEQIYRLARVLGPRPAEPQDAKELKNCHYPNARSNNESSVLNFDASSCGLDCTCGLNMCSAGIESVNDFTASFKRLLASARDVKPDGGIEPALTTADFEGEIEAIGQRSQGAPNRDYAAIETACRNIFYDLLVRLHIRTKTQTYDLRRQDLSMVLHSAKYGTSSMFCPSSRT